MKNKSNIVFLLMVLVLLGGGFFWFTNYRDTGVSSGDSESLLKAQRMGMEFVDMSDRMRKISINENIFENVIFQSLEDLTPRIEMPQQVGRRNPFSFFNTFTVEEEFDEMMEDEEGEGAF